MIPVKGCSSEGEHPKFEVIRALNLQSSGYCSVNLLKNAILTPQIRCKP